MALTKLKTSGIADDAVTTDKLANAINTERTANTAKVSTTINNNADNRVITGSGTANTLEGESGLTYNGSSVLTVSGSGQQDVLIGSTDAGGASIALDGDSNGDGAGSDYALIRHNTDGNLEITTKNPSGATATIFTQGTAESMRIDSSGKVGIGTTAPLKTLTTKAGSNTHAFYIAADNDATDGWGFHADSSSGALKIDRSIDNNFGYRRATFHEDGGLCFGSDTAAANALDDYEEGTWTPIVKFDGGVAGQSYAYQTGTYTKIGRQVFFSCYLQFNNKGTSAGNARLYGLPFTAANIAQNYAVCSVWMQNGNLGEHTPTGYVQQDSTYFNLQRQKATSSGGEIATWAENHFNNNSDIMVSGHYCTA